MKIANNYVETADGSLLFYTIYGAGFPLFLLHGNNNDGSFFEHQISSFTQKYQVFVIDTRGHGRSTNHSKQLSFQQIAADLKTLMDHEGIRQANILGFSDGANIAMVFAHQYPERVHRIVLNSGNTKVLGLKTYWILLIYLQYFYFWCWSFFSQQAEEKRQITELMIHDIGLSDTDLTQIQTPTLVIVGKHDAIKLKHTLMIVNHLSHATFALVPKQGHRLAQTDALHFNQEVLSFLGGNTYENN